MEDMVYRLGCSCGCGDGFEFRAAYGRLYVHSFRGDWYAEQGPGVSGLRDRLRYARGERVLREVVLEPWHLEGVRTFLEGVPFDSCWRPESYRYSKLSFHVDDCGGEPLYSMALVGRMPARGILLGWYHRMFDMDLGPDDRDRLVREIGEILGD